MERTRQEIFDLAWNGLKAQAFAKSVDADEVFCMYRGPYGLKCAIGHCIPDDAYFPDMDNNPDISVTFAAAGIRDDDTDFAFSLQRCHDRAARPKEMEANLRKFAAIHSLTIPA